MVSLIGGLAILAAGLAYFAFKARIVYWVAREPENAGGVPTLDAVIFPPLFCTLGAWFAAGPDGAGIGFPGWGFVGLWLALVVAAFGGLAAASRLGVRGRRLSVSRLD